MSQIILNIIFTTCILSLFVFSFSLLFRVISFFHIAHAITLTLGPYFTYLFSIQIGLSMFFALPLAICNTVLLLLAIDQFVYQPLKKEKIQNWQMLVASLGIYVVLQNIVSLIWGNRTLSIRNWPVTEGYSFLGGHLTGIQLIAIFVSMILLLISWLCISKTNWGKKINAVSLNPELSKVFGISLRNITILAYILSSSLAACVGILIALDTNMRPTMGFDWLLYAVVAMIIGGIGKLKYLFLGTLILVTSQQLASYYISSKWMNATAFIILIIFLAWKPYGFSGQKLRKAEI